MRLVHINVTVFLSLTCACACAASNPMLRLAPKDAKSVDVRPMGGGQQVTFEASREYPSSGLEPSGLAAYRAEGWTYCRNKVDGGWQSFVDSTSGVRQRIFQRLSYLRMGEKLITLGERYYSQDANAPSRPSPTTTQQHVTIVAGTSSEEAAKELFAASKASCDPP